ncbi:hypothetical protein BMF94_6185 [Rhodotorula taiwanensis]|uniref:Major facilitator superfamily (MFS) profile domain-containing protein n=1 Tax=Rhodotorula taiwanensis TaxID=741276 RepID=A0A2S5B1X3_9BASI|nr:hypothetical protein BMF94_6185 [Rhodotorula taiwanensis]
MSPANDGAIAVSAQSASRSSSPELDSEALAGISFDENETDNGDKASMAPTDSASLSFHEAASQVGTTQERTSTAGGSDFDDEAASRASTVEPPSPTATSTPIVSPARPSTHDRDRDAVVVIVQEDSQKIGSGRSHVEFASPPSATTPSLSDNKHAYPPPSSNKSSIHEGASSTLPVLIDDAFAEPVHVPPDGGLRAWLNVLGGFLILFSSFGLVSAFGVFQAYFAEYRYTDRTESDISWIGSCQLCLFFLLALVAGPLFDKGRFRYLIGTGSVLWTLSVFLIPEAKTFGESMVVQGILGGLGVGLLFIPSLSIQSHWFAKKRSLAIGLVASGTSVGGICFPIMLNKLIANPKVGFTNGVRAVGAVVAGCLLVANLIMSPHPARKIVKKPPPPPLKQIFTTPYTLLVAGAFIMNWGLWFPNFYVQLYFKQQGASQNATYYALAIFNAGSFLGRVLPNLVADRIFGPFNMQAFCCLLSGIMIYLMRVMTSRGLLILWALFCGFFTGGFISLVSPVVVSVSNNSLAEIGLRQGIAFVLIAGSAVGGNPVAGRLISDAKGDFLDAILFSGTTVVVGACLVIAGRMVFAKEKGTWRV